jgi:hypothetical protein
MSVFQGRPLPGPKWPFEEAGGFFGIRRLPLVDPPRRPRFTDGNPRGKWECKARDLVTDFTVALI